MKNNGKNPRLSVCFHVFSLIFSIFAVFTGKSSAAASWPVNIIQSPVFTAPAVLVLSEDRDMPVSLRPGAELVELEFISQDGKSIKSRKFITPSPSGGARTFTALIAGLGLENGLYGLRATVKTDTGEATDFQPRSVWVLDRAPGEITFAHLADPHVGDPRATLAKSKETPTERRLTVYRAASESGAQFVIITGDIVSVPGNCKVEYPQAYQELLDTVKIPLFLTTGNHDLYSASGSDPKADGLTFWHRWFGPDRQSFSLGSAFFLLLNTYDWPRENRNFINQLLMQQSGSYASGAVSGEQLTWAKEELAAAKEAGSPAVCAGHHSPPGNLAPVMEKTPASSVPRDEVADTLAAGCLAFLAGHTHRTASNDYKGMKVYVAGSASSDIPPDQSWGYNICKVKISDVSCEFIPVVAQLK